MNASKLLSTIVTSTAAILACPASLYAQAWANPGTSTITAAAEAYWEDLINPALIPPGPDCTPGCALFKTDLDAVGAMIPGFFTWDFGNQAFAQVNDKDPGCFCKLISARAYAQARGKGIGTNKFEMRWSVSAKPWHNSERETYIAWGEASLSATINVTVVTTPPGQAVTVFYSWWADLQVTTINEAVTEDPAEIQNITLTLNGTDLIDPAPNIVNGWFRYPNPGTPGTGSFGAVDGDVISISVTGDALAQIMDPPQVESSNFDHAHAFYKGGMTLRINQPLPPVYPDEDGQPIRRPEFSLDIGSDTELSDPFVDGDEVFDPGDTYPWGGPLLPLGGDDGFRDDAMIFGFDFWPDPPDGPPALSAAETCSGVTPVDVLGERFDLDGTDALDFDLSSLLTADAPLLTPIPFSLSNCVNDAESLLISFDDDTGPHYADASCSVAVDSTSPSGDRYGTTLERDEIWSLNLSFAWPPVPGVPPGGTPALSPLLDEVSLHPSLAPNPDTSNVDDDDVDALDVNFVLDLGASCDIWYFSPDHEATGIDPLTLTALDPGGIYQVGPLGGAPILVVDEDVHLGVPEETDIDAFEFVWLDYCEIAGDPGSCDLRLAMLFSVDDNDVLVPGDESGGLDPNMIYASFLDGTYFELLDAPLPDDIDALAASDVPFLPVPCFTTGRLIWWEDFEPYPIGSGIAGINGWETLANDPAFDAFVTDLQSRSGTQSLEIVSSSNVVQPVSNATSGQWSVSTWVYVPVAATGIARFALWNEYSAAGGMGPQALSVELFLDADLGIVVDAIAGNILPLVQGSWVELRAEIDFSSDQVAIYYDGALLDQRSWTLGVGMLELAAINLTGDTISLMYADDLSLTGNPDCDGNGVGDLCDIALGNLADLNGNGFADMCESCNMLAARSCAQHDCARLCLDLMGGSNVENRITGSTELEIDFAIGTTPASPGVASIDCTDNAGIVTSHSGSASVNGDTVTVTFAPALPDENACVVTLNCGASVCIRMLQGDINRNGTVTTGDFSAVRFWFNQTACAAGAEFDFNTDNGITTGDASGVRFFFNNTAPICP